MDFSCIGVGDLKLMFLRDLLAEARVSWRFSANFPLFINLFILEMLFLRSEDIV